MLIDLFMPTTPIAQPRPGMRVVSVFSKKKGRMVATARTHGNEQHAIHQFREELKLRVRLLRPTAWSLEAAYKVMVVVYRKPPKRLPKRCRKAALICRTKPDGDNYLKGAVDALKGVLWADDGRLYDSRVVKLYAGFGQVPGVRVVVKAVTADDVVEDVERLVSEFKS